MSERLLRSIFIVSSILTRVSEIYFDICSTLSTFYLENSVGYFVMDLVGFFPKNNVLLFVWVAFFLGI